MADEELLEIGPGTVLRLRVSEDERLEVEASYDGGGSEPPAHLHPAQDERFEVLEGTMRARIGDLESELRAGDELAVPAGTVHQMWNAGAERAVMLWSTTPAGRTLDWFRELAALRAGRPLEDPATLLDRYSDTFRLAG